MQLRILLLKRIDLGHGEEISVVAQGIFAVLCGVGEHLHVHVPVVKLLADSGVHGQLPDGVAVVDFQNGRKFLWAFQSKPRFDGDGQGCLPEHFRQKGVQCVQVSEHTAALALGYHSAGGTACIQVDLRITPVPADLGRPEKILRAFGQNLGDRNEIHTVCHGQLPFFFMAQLAVNGGGEEGHIIAVHTGEMLVVQPPEHAVRQPLHGSEVVVHKNTPTKC